MFRSKMLRGISFNLAIFRYALVASVHSDKFDCFCAYTIIAKWFVYYKYKHKYMDACIYEPVCCISLFDCDCLVYSICWLFLCSCKQTQNFFTANIFSKCLNISKYCWTITVSEEWKKHFNVSQVKNFIVLLFAAVCYGCSRWFLFFYISCIPSLSCGMVQFSFVQFGSFWCTILY